MKHTLRGTSLVLFVALSLFFIWFGVTYAGVRDILSFHAAAVPEAVRDQVKPLYFALMTLIGAASAALGVLGLYVIAVPLRSGAPGAATVLVATNTIAFAMAAVTAEKLAVATGAPTSWTLMGIGLAVTLAAFLAHTGSKAMGRSSPGVAR